MSKVNVINNAGKDLVVTVDKNDDEVQIIIDLIADEKRLSELNPGDVFKDEDGEEYILWYFTDDDDAAVLKKDSLQEKMGFSYANNNYDGCIIDKYLNHEYYNDLVDKFGKENIVKHDVDLLSLDGCDDYGVVTRDVSIPTIDQYRKHRKTIGKKLNCWWWLATPDSTPSGCGSGCVRYVGSDGRVGCGGYDFDVAVRPFFVLKSSIFVSCK